MNLLIINKDSVSVYYFNEQDAQVIISRCKAAGKQWADNLVGFFINLGKSTNHAAINIQGNDGVVESMEYIDIDTNKPEFTINHEFITNLLLQTPNTDIKLIAFESILNEMLSAPVKARKWEVYPAVNKYYQPLH